MYYFAYGSNMNHEQMKKRCPSGKFITRALLSGYKYVYDGYSSSGKGAVSNIIKSANDAVWGGLFEINEDNLAALDCYEGHPISYQRQEIEINDEANKIYKAWVYLRTGKKKGEPSEKYRSVVFEGAKNCNLPEDYIKNNIWGISA